MQQVISARKKIRWASIYVTDRYDKRVQKIDSPMHGDSLSRKIQNQLVLFIYVWWNCALETIILFSQTHTKPSNNYIKLHKVSCLKLNTRTIMGSIAQDMRCEKCDLIDNCSFTHQYVSVLPSKCSTNASFMPNLFKMLTFAVCVCSEGCLRHALESPTAFMMQI